jgi:hypothetical protein
MYYMPSDNLLYNVFVAIPVDKEDRTMFHQGYQYREELTEHLVDLDGRWIGSGFGCFCDTATHQVFDIQVAYANEDGANRATVFAKKWLQDRGYNVSPGNQIRYDGEAYAFWVKFDPNRKSARKPTRRPKTKTIKRRPVKRGNCPPPIKGV